MRFNFKKYNMIFMIALIFSCTLFSFKNYAYRWVKYNEDWFVYDINSDVQLKNTIHTDNNYVYYLDENGKMVTGWWQNPETLDYYFFDNNVNRKYGAMIFGMQMVDGYFRYFNDNGTLAFSNDKDSYINVYQDFWVDYDGKVYYLNELMRDISDKKSPYYSNPIYYTNDLLNNFYLANYDTPKEIVNKNSIANNNVNNEQFDFGPLQNIGANTNNNTNTDDNLVEDRIITSEDAEKLGPAA